MQIGKLYRDRAKPECLFLIVALKPVILEYRAEHVFDYLHENSIKKSIVRNKEEFDKAFEEIE